jgi:hypothetical protein
MSGKFHEKEMDRKAREFFASRQGGGPQTVEGILYERYTGFRGVLGADKAYRLALGEAADWARQFDRARFTELNTAYWQAEWGEEFGGKMAADENRAVLRERDS